MAGSDMWWHIAAGRELVQTGTIWMVDDWSFTEHGSDWLNHEWLADLLYYGWVSLWGVQSLVYWKWLVIVATFMALMLALQRTTGSGLAALLCAGLAVANAAPFLDVRPHLYTLLGFCLLLQLRLQRPGPTWPLALLFLVWVNLHGGFFFGLMALAILLFPWRAFSADALRTAAITGCVCLLACLLNPSGYEIFLYPLAYAFDEASPFRQIGEWLSPFEAGGISSPLFFYLMWLPLLALAYLVPVVRRSVGVPWEGMALTALTLAMALTSRRFIPLFGISLAVMLAPLLALCLKKLWLEKLSPVLTALVLVFAVYRLLPYPVQSGPAFHYLTAEYSYPVDMMNFIEANDISGNVFALWNWGGYIHWRTDGKLKVYVDGRADTVYGDDIYLSYVDIMSSVPGWIDMVEETDADYMLWPLYRKRGVEKLRELIATQRWRPVYTDSVSWLLARSDRVPETEREPSTPGPWRYLSAARNSHWAGELDRATDYAGAAREIMPWHRGACDLQAGLYRQQGKAAEAEAVLRDCLAYFPTVYLR